MHVVDVVQRLAATSGRLDKEQIIIDAFMNGHRAFFLGAKLAYDVMITFGVAKVAEIAAEDLNPDDPGSLSFDDFLALADKLHRRVLTGHAARDAINAAATACHGPTWNLFYRRVLLKDLNLGLTDGTINRVLKKLAPSYPEAESLMVPVFACQLAEDGENEKHAAKVCGTKLLDIKLDGVRVLTILDKEENTVKQFMRDGKPNENFDLIRTSLQGVLDKLPGSVVLDGEMVGKSFQELMTQVNRKLKVSTDNARLALFDMIPLADFKTGVCSVSQRDRHAMLALLETSGLLRAATGDRVFVVPKVEVDLATPEGQATYQEFNRNAIEMDYEGIMIKNPDAPYRCRRTVDWLKCKPTIEVSLSIVGFEEGKADGKNKGRLGAFICKGEDDGRLIESNVGTGFSDAQRDEFWAKRDALLGMIVEVRADKLTQERGSEVWSLRFPRFKGFRGTQPGEKL